MEEEEFTPEWVKENLCMDDGNDITECYSEGTIEHIAWCLRCWENLDYANTEEVLNQFHLTTKNKSKMEKLSEIREQKSNTIMDSANE